MGHQIVLGRASYSIPLIGANGFIRMAMGGRTSEANFNKYQLLMPVDGMPHDRINLSCLATIIALKEGKTMGH